MQEYFSDFPAHSRVWVYQANKEFPVGAEAELQPEFDQFAATWVSHQKQVKAEIHLLHQYFIVIMVDEDYHQPSGCGIDTSVHFIKDIGKRYGIDLFDRMRVSYLFQGVFQNCALNEFANRLHSKELTADTIVVNTLVQSKEELQQQFTIPVSESWLKKYL